MIERSRDELGINKAVGLPDEWLSTSETIGLRESVPILVAAIERPRERALKWR